MENSDYKVSMGEFKGKVLASLEGIERDMGEVKEIALANREKITELQYWRAKVIGMSAAVGALSGLIIDWVKDKI